ncbi:hypothetical protein [Prosthecodimorpha staleyi]|uniref:Uncharacterized protein n=1 Tax=Prosthecodimorpha staleyi TaxID=2840188 RepID=A0A947GCZ0_9HYPH|nr:hypothetical protein [Prosthecodimorpha staleyi]MBT9290282.1 hypothetical protein [Prosthecodimorpha staleyi]
MIVLLAVAVLSGLLSGLFCRVNALALLSLAALALHAVAALVWGWAPGSAILSVLAVQIGFAAALLIGAMDLVGPLPADPLPADPVRKRALPETARRTPHGLRP